MTSLYSLPVTDAIYSMSTLPKLLKLAIKPSAQLSKCTPKVLSSVSNTLTQSTGKSVQVTSFAWASLRSLSSCSSLSLSSRSRSSFSF